MRTMLKSKIHRATVTGADVNYEEDIALDPILMDAPGILPYGQVHTSTRAAPIVGSAGETLGI